MGLTWSEQLSVGNAMIDSDHKNLIAAINRVEDAIKKEDRAALSTAFELFDAYMHIHTQNEEKISEAVNYPFAQDKLAQQQLMDEMRYMINKLEGICSAWPDNLPKMYSRFLTGWMTDHIIKTNMQMKRALQNYPYDFIPGKNPGSYTLQTAMILPIGRYIESRPPVW